MTGSITAEDPEGLEPLRLRGEVERLTKLLDAEKALHVDTSTRLKRALGTEAAAQSARHALELQLAAERNALDVAGARWLEAKATLTAERDALMRDHGELIAARDAISPIGVVEGELPALIRAVVRTLTAERDELRTRIENAEAGSVIAKAAIDRLTAERDVAVRLAVDMERELCAQVADAQITPHWRGGGVAIDAATHCARHIAAAIRARSSEGEKP